MTYVTLQLFNVLFIQSPLLFFFLFLFLDCVLVVCDTISLHYLNLLIFQQNIYVLDEISLEKKKVGNNHEKVRKTIPKEI